VSFQRTMILTFSGINYFLKTEARVTIFVVCRTTMIRYKKLKKKYAMS
jgi:hypothetical protein